MASDPHPQTARLQPIIGAWRTEGEVLGDDGETVVQTFSGSDTYEWLGRFFVIHRVDVTMGDEHVENLEMIGPYDPERGAFLTAVYDAASGQVERSIATIDDAGVWTFRAGEGASRGQAALHVDEDGKHMRAAWSRTEDDGATWRPWMRVTLTSTRATA
jgi:Protein of unknown function (DUF1579)